LAESIATTRNKYSPHFQVSSQGQQRFEGSGQFFLSGLSSNVLGSNVVGIIKKLLNKIAALFDLP
jgi:hypothetical protein